MKTKKYRIKYSYMTGDSFGSSSGNVDFLELTWTNLKSAKESLDRIKEHYKWFRELNSHSCSTKKRAELRAVDAPWMPDDKRYEFCLKIVTDTGADFQFSARWCGYFERLEWAEVVEELPEPTGMKIVFTN